MGPGSSQIRILTVDDHPVVRHGIEEMLPERESRSSQ